MEKTPRLHIFEPRELRLLALLAGAGAAFTFTLGLHWGKDLSLKQAAVTLQSPQGAPATADQAPAKSDIPEQSAAVAETLDEVGRRHLHREVVRTGLKLDREIPTELPKAAARPNSGSTTVDRYSIQVGSFPTQLQAQRMIKKLSQKGLRARIVKSGQSYRVLLGGFLSRRLAEEMAGRYKKFGWISESLVARSPK